MTLPTGTSPAAPETGAKVQVVQRSVPITSPAAPETGAKVQVVQGSVPIARVARLVDVGGARDPIPSVAESGIVSRDLEPRLSMVIADDREYFEAEWIDADTLLSADLVMESAADLVQDGRSAVLKEDLVVALALFERALVCEPTDPFAGSAAAFCRFMLKPRDEAGLAAVDELEVQLQAGPEDPWLRFFAVRMCLRAERHDEAAAHLAIFREHISQEPRLTPKLDELLEAFGASDHEAEPPAPAGPAVGREPATRRPVKTSVKESIFEGPLGAAAAVLGVTTILAIIGVFNSGTSGPALVWVRGFVLALVSSVLIMAAFRGRVASIVDAPAGLLPVLGGLVLGLTVGPVLPPVAVSAVSPGGLAAACLFHVAAIEAFFRLYVDQALFERVPTRVGCVIVSASLFGIFALHDPQVLAAPSWADGLLHVGVVALFGGVPFAALHVTTRSVVPPFLCHLIAQWVVVFGS